MTEQEPPKHISFKKEVIKLWFYTNKSVELLVRILVMPATIGLYSPPQKSSSDVLVRGGVDVLSLVLWVQILHKIDAAGWDRWSMGTVAISFLIFRFVGVSVVEHLPRDN